MAEAARAVALLSGRPTVGFEDVKAVAAPVLNHRLILNYKARLDQVDTFAVVRDLLAAVEETGLNLPADFSIAEGKDA
jgi:MoxR-like ATPase